MKAPALSDPQKLSDSACISGRPFPSMPNQGVCGVIGPPRPIRSAPIRTNDLAELSDQTALALPQHKKRNQILALSDAKRFDITLANCRLHVMERDATKQTSCNEDRTMDMLDFVYGTAAVMVVMVAVMVKVSLNTCRYRR